ncbi:MAG: SLBB domain-containing protein [Candidatus Latescibacteria bacterium]|nr:SLBB domain-containing protein [Candidatus Latescibacterota bacterium]
MNLHHKKLLFIVLIWSSVFVNSAWGQREYLDEFSAMRGYNQSPYPYGIPGDVDIPSIMEGQTTAEEQQLLPKEMTSIESLEILFDKTVNADEYYIGPGDELAVYLWGELDQEYRNFVTPEGYFLLPTVGLIKVSDISLAEARTIIKEKVFEKYKDIDASVVLSRPRRFKLYISGLILQPGMINTNSLERVSDIIERAGLIFVEKLTTLSEFRETKTTNSEIIEKESNLIKQGSSQRSITIYRGDEHVDVDLLRFRKMGDINANPYIRSGDRIHVPPYMGNLIIRGEVHDPDIYEFKKGDTIADLIEFGGGLTVLADTSRANLVRFDDDGVEPQNIDIDLYDAIFFNPDKPEYQLKESDRLYVRAKYNYKVIASVLIDGQVKYTGEYAIMPGKTTLTDVIRMAGGFTDKANLEEARLIRQTTSALQDLEYQRLRRMRIFEMNAEEYDYYRSRNRSVEGEITTDFVKLFIDQDMSLDVPLQQGDNIFIPFKRELISISGAVNEPGYVKIEPGADVKYYIAKAGGYKFDANTRKVRIIKAKTGQRFKPGRNARIEGGDIIHVPEKIPLNKWELFRDTAQVFANVVTIILLARRITE